MKIVAISDTHGRHERMMPLPKGDVLVVAGDFTSHGKLEQTKLFGEWLARQDFKHKIVVAGNHNLDFQVDPYAVGELIGNEDNIYYLEDDELVIDGVKFYGSPWTPNYYDWAFMMPRGSDELKRVWAAIPEDTDVLITHGPPAGILDNARDGMKSGDADLLARVKQLKNLSAHIFGHIHEGHGMADFNWYGHGPVFYNVAICDIHYQPVNQPTAIEIRG